MSLEVTHSVQMEWKSLGGDFQANCRPLIIRLSTTSLMYLQRH